MQLRMWMYDLAREQCPTHEFLRHLCQISLDSGYNAIGLYLEHRFAYRSVPWAHGLGVLTPETVRALETEFPELQIIPFINLLGHFEGMLYASGGEDFAEERFKGLSACPCNPEFRRLCEGIIDDTLAAFMSSIIHVGGDETSQLGVCSKCAERVAASPGDGKAELYIEHMAALVNRVTKAGRQAAVWGDMFEEHPTALDALPEGTIIFDWKYFRGPARASTAKFPVVNCPAVHAYNATWVHLPQTEANAAEHIRALDDDTGFCLTTWEAGLFGNYNTILPIVKAVGKMLAGDIPSPLGLRDENPTDNGFRYGGVRSAEASLAEFAEESEAHAEWARLMGVELQDCGEPFAFTGIRSSIKCRMLLYSNPFLLWLRDRDALLGDAGNRAYKIAQRATAIAPCPSMRGVSEFLRLTIEFVRHVDAAAQAYANHDVGRAITKLAPARQVFESLESIARATHINAGGSLADIERCRSAKHHVETVIKRIKEYGGGSLGYLPSFETISHPKFVPHDQANWWLINRWANE